MSTQTVQAGLQRAVYSSVSIGRTPYMNNLAEDIENHLKRKRSQIMNGMAENPRQTVQAGLLRAAYSSVGIGARPT